jgi:FkbM family methyltransferase
MEDIPERLQKEASWYKFTSNSLDPSIDIAVLQKTSPLFSKFSWICYLDGEIEKSRRVSENIIMIKGIEALIEFFVGDSFFDGSVLMYEPSKANDSCGREKTLEDLKKGVYVRGKGVLGKQSVQDLNRLNIPIIGILDEKSKGVELRGSVVLIATSKDFEVISGETIAQGGRAMHLLDFYQLFPELDYPEATYKEDINTNQVGICFLAMSLADKTSLSVLNLILKYRIRKKRDGLSQARAVSGVQWIEFERFTNKKIQVTVDGGAYDGDSASLFLATFPEIQSLYLYEIENKLRSLAQEKFILDERVNVSNFGLADTKKIYVKESKGLMNGRLLEGEIPGLEEQNIECTSLDIDVEERIDLIKLDIEGFEKQALEGSSKHLADDKPIIASAVYHKSSDLHEIPVVIAKYLHSHEAYIRHYTEFSFETIYYAIPTG